MRTMTLAFSILLFGVGFAACGNDNNIQLPDLAGRDMATVSADMAVKKLTCGELVDCLNNCGETDRTCIQGCVRMASTTATSLIQDLFTCLDQNCSSDAAATNCVEMVQTPPNGACVPQLTACSNDM